VPQLEAAEHAHLVELETEGGADHVPGVAQARNPAFLVTVAGRDRDLDDARVHVGGLKQDIGVEMKVIGVHLEGNTAQKPGCVGAIAGVVLAQAFPGQPILESRQNAVSNPLVERHSASTSTARLQHARAENDVGVPAAPGGYDLGQQLRRILTVTVKKDDQVITTIDGHAVAKLLVAAISLIDRVAENGDPIFQGVLANPFHQDLGTTVL